MAARRLSDDASGAPDSKRPHGVGPEVSIAAELHDITLALGHLLSAADPEPEMALALMPLPEPTDVVMRPIHPAPVSPPCMAIVPYTGVRRVRSRDSVRPPPPGPGYEAGASGSSSDAATVASPHSEGHLEVFVEADVSRVRRIARALPPLDHLVDLSLEDAELIAAFESTSPSHSPDSQERPTPSYRGLVTIEGQRMDLGRPGKTPPLRIAKRRACHSAPLERVRCDSATGSDVDFEEHVGPASKRGKQHD